MNLQESRNNPVILLASPRSGSTFLCDAISRHPDVFCWRYEPINRHSQWTELFGDRITDVLECLLHAPHYDASLIKLVYGQAFALALWKHLVRARPKIILLRRRNYLAQAASSMIMASRKTSRQVHPGHAIDESPPPFRIKLTPADVVAQVRKIVHDDEDAVARTERMERLTVFYEDIVGHEVSASQVAPALAKQLCSFMRIEDRPLYSRLRRVNHRPLREIIINWDEVVDRLTANDLGEFLLPHREDGCHDDCVV